MNVNNLIPTDDLKGCPFPFFGELNKPAKKVYKIYNDGGHFIATPVYRGNVTRKPQALPPQRSKTVSYTDEQKDTVFRRISRDMKKQVDKNGKKLDKNAVDKIDLTTTNGPHSSRSALDILFDSLYFQAYKQGLKDNKLDKAMTDFIRAGILKLFPDKQGLDEYIADKIKRKLNNLLHRKKRFRRKANLNCWNYFVTFTYDDTKHTAETFKKKLRKCLSNLHTRRGWKYMGVFEQAPETGRLHFHGLIYVPTGEMLGTITEIQDYSTAQGKMQTRNENKFFADNFGRNDFCEVSKSEMKNGKRTEYILKYIGKTNERICYSRGIPTEICRVVDGDDIITEMHDFVTKYILFDDIIDWERDIMRYRYNKQMSITDLLCNPPLSA
ncbi:MAG: hypothetical protein K2K60_01505 [Clostridia bacterium]|nr:hypothetical protein [Clostridia bacterium]